MNPFSVNPLSSKFLDENLLGQLFDHYGATSQGINKTLLLFEVRKFKGVCGDQQQQGATVITPEYHPNPMELFHFKRSIPVSSAEAEHSFSTIKRVKSSLRNGRTLCPDKNIDIFNEKPR